MDVRFGKRLVSEARDKSPTVAATLAVAAKPIGIPAIQSAPPTPQPASEPQRSDDYYVTKSMIFGALVEAIDLSQLSRLDAENAREEIRDIVHEIVAIKNVAPYRQSGGAPGRRRFANLRRTSCRRLARQRHRPAACD